MRLHSDIHEILRVFVFWYFVGNRKTEAVLLMGINLNAHILHFDFQQSTRKRIHVKFREYRYADCRRIDQH